MEKIFFTSDTHFNHFNIIKYSNRPFNDINEMNNTIITNWNNVVSPKDIVIHVGDFSFSSKNKISEMVEQLNGGIVLVRGNHDKISKSKLSRCGFVSVEDFLIIEDFYVWHYPIYTFDPDKEWYVKKKNEILGQFKKFIHGHIHNNPTDLNPNVFQFNCGTDVNNFTPVNFNYIKNLTSDLISV